LANISGNFRTIFGNLKFPENSQPYSCNYWYLGAATRHHARQTGLHHASVKSSN